MVGEMRRGRPPKNASNKEEKAENESKNNDHGKTSTGYEQFREQRIKENFEKMEKMGILDLSRKIKSGNLVPPKPKRPKTSQIKPPAMTPSGSARRSSRLHTMIRVNYAEKPSPKRGKSVRNAEIRIERGTEPEIYTEEHEKLLGDCKNAWVMGVDGYGEDGKRIYDQIEGKSCHQCRQKTLGQHTECSTCKIVQGQFCGDCLFARYGENVVEANENPSWICPVCRGICNCSNCRLKKGWKPTGAIYRKVIQLGFKSVAHHLIQTMRSQNVSEEPTGEYSHSANISSPSADGESESSDEISKPQSDHNSGENVKEVSDHVDVSGAHNKDGHHEDPNAVDNDNDGEDYGLK